MAEYICVDGPLEGRLFRWRKAPRTGEPLTVAVVDVDHAVLEVDYRVTATEEAGSGRLEFVGARDAHGHGTTSLLSRVRRVRGRVADAPGRTARAASDRLRRGHAALRH
ncbi:hypothetical protein [Cellulomonas aerilata]|uniref:Uncharacterized protein n=1 Tax=Cellulomonas aerilata TaxID=515326 RepID=A0A512DC44_9CELL|nr:hypothetical protein [Cellulomonas aerilata]GEO34052.1 hypothetical protein CAE01nite_17770 [Cellulomonas aerilata]